LPESLMYYAYDLYYGRTPKDYAGQFLADQKAQAETAKFPSPPARPAPPRDLTAYTGAYKSPYFGALAAEVRSGRLELRIGPRKALVQTKHWDGDTFAISLPGYGDPTYTDGLVSFQFGSGDKPVELRFFRTFDDAGNGRFAREADRP
jgi:hypothetical protein